MLVFLFFFFFLHQKLLSAHQWDPLNPHPPFTLQRYHMSEQIIGCSAPTFICFPLWSWRYALPRQRDFDSCLEPSKRREKALIFFSFFFSAVCLMTRVTFGATATGDLCARLCELCAVIIRRSPLNCKFSQLYSPLSIHYFKTNGKLCKTISKEESSV